MIGVVAEAAAAAFVDVGVWVAVTLALVAVVQHRTDGRFLERLTHSPAAARTGAALLGVLPGCGGAVVVVPLYLRGSVPFGAVVAALVATMGDSSFVLIAADPGAAAAVHALLLAAGLLTGAVVDRLGLDPRARAGRTVRTPARVRTREARSVGAAAAPLGLLGRPVFTLPSTGALAFWCLAGAGLVAGAPVAFGVTAPAVVGGVDLLTVLGVAGTALCVVVVWRGRGLEESTAQSSLWAALEDAGRTAARLTAWVAAAYVILAAVLAFAGYDPAGLSSLGMAGVVAGAAVGLIPGCGAQVMLTTLYAHGVLPFATLVANALSQDGDALFPLLAADRRAAVVVSAVTLAPAILTGTVVHAFLG